jgi:outer membrane protein TolC
MLRSKFLILIACTIAFKSGLMAQQNPPVRLHLRDAVQLGLKANLGVQVAHTQVSELAGTRERRLAVLLPHVSGQALANLQNRNLRAFGLSSPAIPELVGPFSNYDFRVYADQTLIDRQATHALRASDRQEQSAKLTYEDTKNLVIRQAAGLYLQAESASAEVQSSQSRVDTAQVLLKLAEDQRGHGLATGIDVVRAQVQLQRERQRLLAARNTLQTALLALQRFIGMTPGTPIELADELEFRTIPLPDPNETLQTALQSRADYRALQSQRDSLVEQQKASGARYLPKLALGGNYGALGRSFDDLPGTGIIQATVSVSLFDRDRNGERHELESRKQRVEAQLGDLQRQIHQELLKAVLDVGTAEDQVKVSEEAMVLAERELSLARDRFRNGLSDNIEITNAQDALRAAQDDHIQSLAAHADAKMAMVRAMGGSEKAYQDYFPAKSQ